MPSVPAGARRFRFTGMIAIVDCGMGNLRSVEKALLRLGHPACVTSDPEAVLRADRVVLPGVGAFGAAMASLTRREGERPSLAEAVTRVIAAGRPFLGICLGMQLLLTESEELGRHRGLGVVPGRVVRFDAHQPRPIRVPHMGWNALRFLRPDPLFAGIEEGAQVYFVHSYYCIPDDPAAVSAVSEHGLPFCAALSRSNVFATQFHPEKSGSVGLRILDNFARW